MAASGEPGPAPGTAAALAAWADCAVQPVWPRPDCHSLHSYFNACPESPDGRWVLLFVSAQADAHVGDLCLLERASGQFVVVAAQLEVEDAHRQANQQWLGRGDYVVYMHLAGGRWQVARWERRTGTSTVLAVDCQVGWGQPHLDDVPLYGLHWQPGMHRDLVLLNVRTGAVRTAVTLAQVLADYREAVARLFPARPPDAIFFPILSPDGRRVIFKLTAVRDGQFRSPAASTREGLFVYDLATGRSLGLHPAWGHPAWLPDSRHLISLDLVIDTDTMATRSVPWYPRRCNTHPAVSPDGQLLCLDARRLPYASVDLHWAVLVGDFQAAWRRVHSAAAPGDGTASWRPPHPHPVFSADGRRLYFNSNRGSWTALHVAARRD